jgi:ABC-type transport system involved in multi-copper enzyme maturation permease subunit
VKTILLVAADSIQALLHQKILIGLMVASLAFTIFCSVVLSSVRKGIKQAYTADQTTIVTSSGTAANPFVSKMSDSDRRKFQEQMEVASSQMQGFFYVVASFGGTIVALFIFSTAVASEIRKGTIRLTLSKPVSRMQFLLGKYLGGIAVMAGYALIISVAMVLFSVTQGVDLNPAVKWSPWLMFCEQLMIGSVAMLLSLFMPPIIAAVLAFFSGNGLYGLYNPLYYILPSYRDFNMTTQVMVGSLVDWKDVCYLSLYAADFVAIMLLIALWRFRTKELV